MSGAGGVRMDLTDAELAQIAVALAFYGAALASQRVPGGIAMLAESMLEGHDAREVLAVRELVVKISRSMGLPDLPACEPFG